MVNGKKGNCDHCILPADKTSLAVKHNIVEEIWYILSGQRQMCQKAKDEEKIVELKEGVGLTIPNGNHFQFQNKEAEPLSILLVTMAPWTCEDETAFVEGHLK